MHILLLMANRYSRNLVKCCSIGVYYENDGVLSARQRVVSTRQSCDSGSVIIMRSVSGTSGCRAVRNTRAVLLFPDVLPQTSSDRGLSASLLFLSPCLSLSLSLSLCLRLCVSICLSVSVCLRLCVSICLSVSVCLRLCVSVSLSLSKSFSLCLSLSACLSVFHLFHVCTGVL